jgi:hypothetical protein
MCPATKTHAPHDRALLIAVVTVVVGMGKAGKDSSVHRSDACGRAGQQTENGERGKAIGSRR